MLIPSSPFGIKCKKPDTNVKNHWKCIFRGFRREFFIFSQGSTQSWGGGWGVPPIPYNFHESCCNIQFKPYATSKMALFLTKKIGNSWKLLLTVVIDSFILNVTGLLNLTLKHIDKFRLVQIQHVQSQ